MRRGLHYQRQGHPPTWWRSVRWRPFLNLVLALLFLLGWAIFLRPQALGGKAAFIAVKGSSMTPTLRAGDLVLLSRASGYHIGDIIAFDVPAGQPAAGRRVIHRIISGTDAEGYVTKGDYNGLADPWRVPRADVIGKLKVRIPWLGRSVSSIRTVGLSALGAGALLVVGLAAWRVHRTVADVDDIDHLARLAEHPDGGREPVGSVTSHPRGS